jgi:acyl-CoA thioesterase FadM
MARMKIDMPSDWAFKHHIKIRVTDLNYGNHLANQHFLTYAQEARLKYFQRFGFSEKDFGGKGLIQADAAIVYQGEGHLDDEVEIKVTAIQSSGAGFDVFYQFYNLTKQKAMAQVRTAIVCFDYDLKKPIAIPKEVLDSGVLSNF